MEEHVLFRELKNVWFCSEELRNVGFVHKNVLFCSGFVPRTEERRFCSKELNNVGFVPKNRRTCCFVPVLFREMKNVWFCSEDLKTYGFVLKN